MKETELKPCPFCGGEAVLEPYKARKGYEATIQCNGGCLAQMHTITYDTEEQAIEYVVKAWNRRSDNKEYYTCPEPLWCEDCKHFCNADMGGEGMCDIDNHDTWYCCLICEHYEAKGADNEQREADI